MEKDYSAAVRSGFEATGIHPLNLGKALAKLPAEDRDVDNNVTRQLLNKLQDMRYNPAANKHAGRPKNKEKLPAGASYTCFGDQVTVGLAVDEPEAGPSGIRAKARATVSKRGDARDSSSDSSSDFSTSEDEDSSDQERSRKVQNIIQRLSKKTTAMKRIRQEEEDLDEKVEESEESDEDEQEEAVQVAVEEAVQVDAEPEEADQPEALQTSKAGQPAAKKASKRDQPAQDQFVPNSYVVAVYDGDWFVAQVVDKTGEPEADAGEQYLFLNFMERLGDSLKWPRRLDMLNTLKEDVLFVCEPPTVSSKSSSSRSVTYTLSKATFKKAKNMFLLYQASYLTKMNLKLCFYGTSCFSVVGGIKRHFKSWILISIRTFSL
jgi:hypothetical protein